ncbi:MAG: hypothetical protein AB1453_00460 [Chloroflexota bacterium]|jgi:hypothetical protein
MPNLAKCAESSRCEFFATLHQTLTGTWHWEAQSGWAELPASREIAGLAALVRNDDRAHGDLYCGSTTLTDRSLKCLLNRAPNYQSSGADVPFL